MSERDILVRHTFKVRVQPGSGGPIEIKDVLRTVHHPAQDALETIIQVLKLPGMDGISGEAEDFADATAVIARQTVILEAIGALVAHGYSPADIHGMIAQGARRLYREEGNRAEFAVANLVANRFADIVIKHATEAEIFV